MRNLPDPNWTLVMMSTIKRRKASYYSLLCPGLSDPFLTKRQRKLASFLVNLCLYGLLHFICFSFCLLAAWEHCFGKEVVTKRFAGTALAVQSDAGQKSWHLCHWAWIKHGSCFSGEWCLSQHSKEQSLFFLPPCSALFSCQLVENSFFFSWYIRLLQHQYKTVY